MIETSSRDPESKSAEVDETPLANENPDGEASGEPREIGGRKGPEPTRYGDWEKNGRCIDF